MAITLPSAEEIDQYSASLEPRAGGFSLGPSGIPLIADDEPVCRVRALETGDAAYWSRGDVDAHVLHARQHGLTDGLASAPHVANQAWLAHALRARREQRRMLLLNGVQTTASGLVVLHAPAQLVVPTRP